MNQTKPIDTGDVIKHEKFMDVAFDIEFSFDRGDGWLLTGYWLNQGFTKSWAVPYRDKRGHVTTQTFLIKNEDLKYWSKVILPQQDVCLRKCDWVKVV